MAEHFTINFIGDPLKLEVTHRLDPDQFRQLVAAIVGPGKMQLIFGVPTNQQGETTMADSRKASAPGSETDSQTVACTEIETDGNGNPVTLNPSSVQWAIDDPTIATLTQNSDGSATFKAVKPVAPATNPRTANVTCTDTVTGVVGTDQLTVTDSPTKPGSMVLTFGTPA
jgi:hypothetical protein